MAGSNGSGIALNFNTPVIAVKGTMNVVSSRQLPFDSGVIDRMRRWFFSDDGGSALRAKETKETLNAPCVTVSGANLHSLIEQVWPMVKVSIEREQCKTPKQVTVQAQGALAAIST
jgi:hypothetical protein